MSRKNIILLVLLLIVISCSIALYLYIQDKNLTKNIEQINLEQKMHEDAVRVELNNFKDGSTKTEKEVIKELNSFKAPEAETNTTVTNTSTNNTNTGTTTTPPVKPKTEAEVIQELNSFKAPPKK